MEIQNMFLTINKYSRPGTALKVVKGVVIHYMGNPNTTAVANRNWFESLKAGIKNKEGNLTFASSQYIVGLQGEIIRCVPENEVAYCSNSRNNDTISIECCHPLPDGKFTEATYKSLIELVADICKRYSLNPLKDIIRHHDVTGKSCPLYHVNNLEAWESLKKDVQITMNGGKLPEKGYVNILYNNNILEIRADNVDGRLTAKISELSRILGDIKIPIRYAFEAAGCEIGWHESTKTISIVEKNADFDILSRITQAEAGGEDIKGRTLVTNVIMNRVNNKNFPNSIKDVVFQEGQFTPTQNGAYDKAVVTESTKNAVAAALSGEDHSQGALYFCSSASASKSESWHEKALTFLFQHGGHRFYK